MKRVLVAYMSLIIVISFTSCQSYIIKQKGYLTKDNKRVTYKLNPPDGYLEQLLLEAHGRSYQFIYENGGLFYFSMEDFGWNYEEIAKSGKFLIGGPKRDEINSNSGKEANGYWRKEEVKGSYWIGYQNIPEQRKNEFDKVINEFVFKYDGR
ncbi:hypothetical protein [Adhaeribacter pallidiroseus]|uniref:Uncharacterized protein n=1 Tax=Adhaeribacter pallidiroseus TaxID=2072847 RepID=A0A369QT77_9BACT|nr:hypothetical protein [Adhaeribacter pallidiroseus]RDC65368.1 hypothetical protein AHMF7616_03998 [Adhaeribacter pallidiroseus]